MQWEEEKTYILRCFFSFNDMMREQSELNNVFVKKIRALSLAFESVDAELSIAQERILQLEAELAITKNRIQNLLTGGNDDDDQD
jgi:hypothetical protein